ncbi:MAG: redoxin domain-containing protein [Chloroflexi bacterium]|uniref:Redoxin domain-containing protein n=1 Tax=Candidatus Chlorohelix allophototropha TaxID=3003348 RepID=A0A8T7M8Q5_9CHLR|nr:redoxin domain-containing protein [Chloroflexota bacterium]WJW68432.1 redoxin domain-containing protein [Chloroflexota bacterium L227-S17]
MESQNINKTQIKAGEKSPIWIAQSTSGEINLGDYLSNTAILLIFYRADWSDVCSDELPLLEEMIKLSGNIKLKTFGISKDSVASHNAFAHQVGLEQIVLISDPDNSLAASYGLLNADNQCKRATVLIDVEGYVQWVGIEAEINKPRSMTEFEYALNLVRGWSGYTDGIEKWRSERRKAMQIERDTPLASPTKLQVRFWGTRGSIPVSGIDYQRYGGNTSCVSLTSDTGHLFIFDCGSGARELGNYLISDAWLEVSGKEQVDGYIFLSHTHWDHIQGFPFFSPVFKPGNRFNTLGWSSCSQTLMSIMARQMEQIYFPVSLHSLPSELNFFSMKNGTYFLDGAQITGKLLKHPIPSAAYRVELNNRSIVFATDHEPLSLPQPKPNELMGDDIIDVNLLELAHNADILIHDAQFTSAQLANKIGWGHSSPEVAVDTAARAGVKKLVLYHHDPSNDDDTIDLLLELANQRRQAIGFNDLKIVAARDGMTLEL